MSSLGTKLYAVGGCKYFQTLSGKRQNIPLIQHSNLSHATKIPKFSLVKLPRLLQENYARRRFGKKLQIPSNLSVCSRALACVPLDGQIPLKFYIGNL